MLMLEKNEIYEKENVLYNFTNVVLETHPKSKKYAKYKTKLHN